MRAGRRGRVSAAGGCSWAASGARAGSRPGWLGLAVVWVGCVADPDPGGQEGEEAPSEETGTEHGGGDGGGDGDGGADDLDSFSSWVGELVHERGGGRGPGVRECVLVWQSQGRPSDADCADCVFVFAVDDVLDDTRSTGVDQCADEPRELSRNLGFVEDYLGYGPALFSVDSPSWGTYLIAPARLSDHVLTWSYGYADLEVYGGIPHITTRGTGKAGPSWMGTEPALGDQPSGGSSPVGPVPGGFPSLLRSQRRPCCIASGPSRAPPKKNAAYEPP